MAICFYRVDEKPYGCFSNFSRHGFELDGEWWPTSEHYFQAQKLVGSRQYEQVRRAPTPRAAAALGRTGQLRSDWEQVRDEVMHRAVLGKFRSNPELREILVSTGDEVLVEKTNEDYYWGCGSNGTGRNRLGEILMEVREELRRG